MGRNIKRLSLALIALGLSAPVLADSSPFCVTVPNQQGGFTVGADFLWMRPSYPNLVYTATVVTPTTLDTFGVDYHSVEPDYHWGFDLMAAYRIPCTGNDISALWTHLGREDSTNDTSFLLATDPFSGTDVPATVEGRSESRYDAVDVDLGQRVNFGDFFNFRIFAGVRGVDIDHEFDKTSTYTFTSPTPGAGFVNTYTLDQDSEFRGIGPQMGIEGRYCLGYGFGIDASTTFSALVGRQDSDATFTATLAPSGAVASTTSFDVNVERRDRVVPALDMNLGVDYTFNFNNCSRSSLVVQAGYKVIHYWGAHELAANPLATSALDFDGFHAGQNNAGNVSFDGPYVGLKVNV